MEILANIVAISRFVFYVSATVLIVLKVFYSVRCMVAQSKDNCSNKNLKKFVAQTLVLCILFIAGFAGSQMHFSNHSSMINGVSAFIAFVCGIFLIFDWEAGKSFQNKTSLNRLISVTACVATISMGLGVFPGITLFFLALASLWIMGNSILYIFHSKKMKICEYGGKYYVMKYKWLDGWVWIKPGKILVECKHPDMNSVEQYLFENIEDAKEVVTKFQKE